MKSRISLKKIFLIFVIAVDCSVAFAAAGGKITEKKLGNGIPVYFNELKDSEVCSINIAVKGGTIQLETEYAGLENSLFYLMTKGSENYSFDRLSELLYYTKSKLGSENYSSGSWIYLDCINEYTEEMLKVMLDGFMKPAFEKNQVQALQSENEQEVQSALTNGQDIFYRQLFEKLYSDPRYYISDVTEESLKNITVENMKAHLEKLLDASRIIVVISLNSRAVNKKNILKLLENTLGKIENKNGQLFKPETARLNCSDQPVIVRHIDGTGKEYIVRCFDVPDAFSRDYAAGQVCKKAYSEIMYNILRVKYGACYTPYSSVGGFYAPVGMDIIYQASNLKDFTDYLGECKKIMSSGQVVSSVENGQEVLEPLENRLEGYKNAIINAKYNGQDTASGLTKRYTLCLLNYNDFYWLEKNIKEISLVTVEDVVRVFNTYWDSCREQWGCMIGPDDVIDFKK